MDDVNLGFVISVRGSVVDAYFPNTPSLQTNCMQAIGMRSSSRSAPPRRADGRGIAPTLTQGLRAARRSSTSAISAPARRSLDAGPSLQRLRRCHRRRRLSLLPTTSARFTNARSPSPNRQRRKKFCPPAHQGHRRVLSSERGGKASTSAAPWARPGDHRNDPQHGQRARRRQHLLRHRRRLPRGRKSFTAKWWKPCPRQHRGVGLRPDG